MRVVTVYSVRPLWWHWEAHTGSLEFRKSGHSLTRWLAYRAGWRQWSRKDRRERRTERRRLRTVRTIESRRAANHADA